MTQQHQSSLSRSLQEVHSQLDSLKELSLPSTSPLSKKQAENALEGWISAANTLTKAIESLTTGKTGPLRMKKASQRCNDLLNIDAVLGDRRDKAFSLRDLRDGGLTSINQDSITSLKAGGAVVRLGRGQYLLSQAALEFLAEQTEESR